MCTLLVIYAPAYAILESFADKNVERVQRCHHNKLRKLWQTRKSSSRHWSFSNSFPYFPLQMHMNKHHDPTPAC
jgi:hypothetical protein